MGQRLGDAGEEPEGETEGDVEGEELTQPMKKAEPSRPADMRLETRDRPSIKYVAAPYWAPNEVLTKEDPPPPPADWKVQPQEPPPPPKNPPPPPPPLLVSFTPVSPPLAHPPPPNTVADVPVHMPALPPLPPP